MKTKVNIKARKPEIIKQISRNFSIRSFFKSRDCSA